MGKGFDPSELMKQARGMKDQMARIQESLKTRVVEAEAGGGAVKIFANCDGEVVGVKILPDAVDPEEVGMLEDLIQVGVNTALEKAKAIADEEMGKVTGGLGGLGGLF